jgi:hypothetical protein
VTKFDRFIIGVGIACAAVLLYVATPGKARAETLKSETRYTTIRLLDEPCVNADIAKALGTQSKRAKGTFTQAVQTPFGFIPVGTVDMEGCWVAVPSEQKYVTLWTDGEHVTIPMDEFQPEAF